MSEDESSSDDQEDNEVLSDQEDHDTDSTERDPASIPIPRSSFFTDGKAAAEASTTAGAESTEADGGAKEDDADSDKGDGHEEGEDGDTSDGSTAEMHDDVCTAAVRHIFTNLSSFN